MERLKVRPVEANLAIFPKGQQRGRRRGKKRSVLDELELNFVWLVSEKNKSRLKPTLGRKCYFF